MSTVHGFRAAGDLIARQCEEAGRGLLDAEKEGNRAVAVALTGAVAANMGGPSIVLRGAGKNGRRVSVVTGFDGRKAVVSMRPEKIARLIEDDTKAHTINAKKRRNARVGNRLRIGNEWRTGPFHHPGTQGKHPFAKGEAVVKPVAPRIYQVGVRRAIAKAFR